MIELKRGTRRPRSGAEVVGTIPHGIPLFAPRSTPRPPRACLLLLAFAAALPACTPEEKVVRYKPFLKGGEGWSYVGPEAVNANQGYTDPLAPPPEAGDQIVIENPDGTKTLLAKSVRHMMAHLERTLDEGDDELLLAQVISEETKREFAGRGQSEEDIVKFLRKNRKDIAKTFARMPMGENTPSVILKQPGNKTWVLRITGLPSEGLKFTELWARLEGGNWRFVWLR